MPPRPETLGRLVALQPDYGQGQHNLGRSLYELGQVDRALEAFQRAFHHLPPEARAVPLTNMAMVIPGSPAAGNQEILECRRAWATQCLPARRSARISRTEIPGRTVASGWAMSSGLLRQAELDEAGLGTDQPP